MKAAIYLQNAERKGVSLLTYVDVEVCPRGLYQIGGITYQLTGQPKFIISGNDQAGQGSLIRVELIVEEYNPAPKVRVTEC
jgi:hypothetical protein